jgi:plasmid stability protein
MPSITIKDLPEDLHRQLEQEAEANFRSLDQEAAARLAKSFDIEYAAFTEHDQKLVDEALASGPATEFHSSQLDAIFEQVIKKGH